jgi:hypothetical protein
MVTDSIAKNSMRKILTGNGKTCRKAAQVDYADKDD